MINLSGIQVAFFDFDDTICIHMEHDDRPDWFVAQLNGDKNHYLNKNRYQPLLGMKSILEKLKVMKIPIYCLTWSSWSTVEPLKMEFIKHYYGECFTKLICTGSKEDKITFMQKYCEVYSLPPKSVLFVDDHHTTQKLARKAGFEVRTPQEIVVEFARQELLNEYNKI